MAVATSERYWKTVVWERFNKTGKWCPYSPKASQLIEQSYRKNLSTVWLGDADESLKSYSVNLKDFVQVSEHTAKKYIIRRHLCNEVNFVMWQWHDDKHEIWHFYDVDVTNFIENAYQEGEKVIDLSKKFPTYNYEINFLTMSQKNKRTKYQRLIRRHQNAPYPIVKCSSSGEDVAHNSDDSLSNKADEIDEVVPGTNALMKQMNSFLSKLKKQALSSNNSEDFDSQGNKTKSIGEASSLVPNDGQESSIYNNSNCKINPLFIKRGVPVACVDGKPWILGWPPQTPKSKLKPVPGIEPLPKIVKIKESRKKNNKLDQIESEAKFDILNEYTQELVILPSGTETQTCIICCENLSSSGNYSDDKVVVKLKLCSHIFHKACLQAMYDSGPKENYIQCPTCKKIYGVKCGIQPPGEMTYHVIPYSLPGYYECETIEIIYNFRKGIQGPEHPNPGCHYTARGFPRHCYLPDNEMGRKVLRLLIKAWQRRLIFTIGQSSTTGEENTVIWNEIHHKTEFGRNTHGHGYPDPNYFGNILNELESHGITDD